VALNRAQVVEMVKSSLTALGLREGAAHTESGTKRVQLLPSWAGEFPPEKDGDFTIKHQSFYQKRDADCDGKDVARFLSKPGETHKHGWPKIS
jgi:hypothetical protein